VTGGNDPNPANNSATDTDIVQRPVQFTDVTAPTEFTTDTATLDFGNRSGPVSSTVTVTVNSGPVTFGTVVVANETGSAFSKGADTCSGTVHAVGETCTVVVNFNAPTGNSRRTATLSVPYTGAAMSPLETALVGR
jgi:hypothetical protein